MMSNYLLIGGGGFIGRKVAKLLSVNKDNNIVVVDKSPAGDKFYSENKITYIQSEDFLSSSEIEYIISESSVVIYLASTTIPSTSNESPIYDIQTNLIPLLSLLDIIKLRKDVKLIYASSGGTIYGPSEPKLQNESSETNPICSYGVVKLTAEKYLNMYNILYGLKTLSLRIANPYGIDQLYKKSQGAIGVFVSKAIRGEPIEIWGDGEVARDYLWIDDVASAFVKAANYNGNSAYFNIGSGKAITLNQVVEAIKDNISKEIFVQYKFSRNIDVQYNALDSGLARVELHWAPSVSFKEGLSRMCLAARSLS
jgi:UDP-glucose 4-epimerase